MDKSETMLRFAGRSASGAVPRYFLYGQTETSDEWFVNVEPLDKRCREIGWVIEPHAHPRFTQIVFVTSGNGEMTAEGEKRPFAAPSILIVPVNTVHGFAYLEDTTGWVLTIERHYLETIIARSAELGAIWNRHAIIQDFENEGWMTSCVAHLNAIDRELDSGLVGSVISAEGQLISLLVVVLRQLLATDGMNVEPVLSSESELVARFRTLIESQYQSNMTLPDYASQLGVSLSQLRNACLAVNGQPPLKLVHERVLIEAKRSLVYTSASVSQIAYQIGFEDPAYFSRFFTKYVGEPPLQYRSSKAFTHAAM